MKYNLIHRWPLKNLKCHACGTGKGVKYEYEGNSYCSNACMAITSIKNQVAEYTDGAIKFGVSYSNLCGTLFVRADGVTARIKRAESQKDVEAGKFHTVITVGDKVVVLSSD